MLQMIHTPQPAAACVQFGADALGEALPAAYRALWKGGFGTAVCVPQADGTQIYVHSGKSEEWSLRKVKTLCATAARTARSLEADTCLLPLDAFVQRFGKAALHAAAEGLLGGLYHFSQKTDDKPRCTPQFFALQQTLPQVQAKQAAAEALRLAQEMMFARTLVNLPGNQLRPQGLAEKVLKHIGALPIESECLSYETLQARGYAGLVGVGGASAFAPCMLLLRYQGAPGSSARLGIAGKGVTCDTGGYCLKGAGSMAGIKGDMAGAAAAVAALCALAANRVPVNVTACLPLCENRISPDALLPGDVLTLYGGKTVEVLNTDAEGRLILADAVAHLARNEGVTQLVDIATLTGAAWSALGYTMAPALCDDEALYAALVQAQHSSAECFVRFPFGEEHEKMIRSEVADLKNTGGDCCGAITAGLFLRPFAEKLPWLHLDIAGTAWTASPAFAFESFGATGAGAATLYHLAAHTAQNTL